MASLVLFLLRDPSYRSIYWRLKMSLFSVEFLKAAAERAVKTASQTAAATIVASGAVTAWAVDWPLVAGATALATILSVLTSIGSAAATDGSPSLNNAEVLAAS